MLCLLISCASFILLSKSFTHHKPILQTWEDSLRLISLKLVGGFLSFLHKSRISLQPITSKLKKMVTFGSNVEVEREERETSLSLLDLPDLALDCILERLPPSGLCSMAAVCASLRESCTSDHLWGNHMNHKWDRLIGPAAYREWQLHVVSRNRIRNYSVRTEKKGLMESLVASILPSSWITRQKLTSVCKVKASTSCLPVDRIMSLYLSLETGKFWFPAQVYNRDPKYKCPHQMASSSVPSFLHLLLLLLCSVSLSPTSAAYSESRSRSNKVRVELYYETLCPDSYQFIVNDLIKLFETGIISVTDLKLYPYGNARIGSNSTITCQHGPSECLLNTVEACAIEIWPALNDHFPFIYCVESLVYEHKYPQWESCYEKLGLDSKPIAECYSSGLGKELELQYAAETSALQPPHQYVPWVVVDGQPLYEDYENFLSYVCNAYNGTTALEACSKISLNTIQRESSKSTHSVGCEGKMPAVLGRIESTIKSWIRQINLAIWM